MQKFMKFVLTVCVLACTCGLVQAADVITQYQKRFVDTLEYTNQAGRDVVVPNVLLASLPAATTQTVTVTMSVVMDNNTTTNVGDTISVSYAIGSLTYAGSTNWDTGDVMVPAGAVITFDSSVDASTNSVIMYRQERQ
jgi:hypothetical protein